jgi:hypothetical protein
MFQKFVVITPFNDGFRKGIQMCLNYGYDNTKLLTLSTLHMKYLALKQWSLATADAWCLRIRVCVQKFPD